jgi:hypothetical protein
VVQRKPPWWYFNENIKIVQFSYKKSAKSYCGIFCANALSSRSEPENLMPNLVGQWKGQLGHSFASTLDILIAKRELPTLLCPCFLPPVSPGREYAFCKMQQDSVMYRFHPPPQTPTISLCVGLHVVYIYILDVHQSSRPFANKD